ncbi:hypothetical protein HIM_05007 [Hirsutella minnesotensis 3608]|uniref:Coenzyme Q-binding protein COQ10 START domain-containing protein n=1 Tax=Hirsutella minnesotensis 3608 TaxID=1043627 RepID=A0A0F8A5L6_9HYPO|nr:hypothetical protein HIM_05007 [Hirsutella minnesotensis 3608]
MSARVALPRRLAARLASASSPRRFFFNLPGLGAGAGNDATQRLTASRVLPYAPEPLYELIADVDSYHRFVPYCSRSRVTQWSDPDPATGRRWPTLADLHVGWGGFAEAFTSRLRCVPGISVEAVSGDDLAPASAVFKTLVTRWSVQPVSTHPAPSTEVHLTITYQFANPIYAAVSATVSDKVAGLMIEAFEKQAEERLGPGPK